MTNHQLPMTKPGLNGVCYFTVTPYILMRRTKIVCTIGPATSSPEKLEALVRAGMNMARLNFSHGAYEAHAQVFHHHDQLLAVEGLGFGVWGLGFGG